MAEEMGARELLEQVREADEEIALLQRSVYDTWVRLTSTTASPDGAPVQRSADPHRMDAIGEMDDAVCQRIRELSAMKARAVRLIGALPSPSQRRVLIAYYLDGVDRLGRRKTWEGVAYELGYSLRRVQQLQAQGLEAVEKLRGIS